MRITCTVEEFGKLVRGCERAECWKCPLESLCKSEAASIGNGLRGPGIEKFVAATDVVAGPKDEQKPESDLFKPVYLSKWPAIAPERPKPPIDGGGENG